MTPAFLYFDLGQVVLCFDHRLACRQMGAVANVSPDAVWEAVFECGLERRFEAGEVDDRQFYEEFCRATDTRPDVQTLLDAFNAIFWLNTSIVPVVGQLDAAGYRLGILSNTCAPHWEYCSPDRFGVLKSFHAFALSFRVGACKPDPKIYRAAAELAGVAPREIFYVDDIARNVEGAREAGFDAVQYVGTPQLVAELRKRGVRFNY